MRKTLAALAALSLLVTGYKTRPERGEVVEEMTEQTYTRIEDNQGVFLEEMSRRIDGFEPKAFIESCIDGTIVVKTFLFLDIVKMPGGDGLGTVAVAAFGKVWTFGEKVNSQVMPMLAEAIDDYFMQALGQK